MRNVEIVTPRLVLRGGVLADVPVVQAAKLAVWDELQRFTVFAREAQKPLEALEEWLAHAGPMESVFAFRRDTGAFAVSTGLTDEHDGGFEIGYWVPRDQRGEGFAGEATNALARFAFAAMGAREVRLSIYEGNVKSTRVVEKLGFAFVRTDLRGRKRCLDDAPVDVHWYALNSPAALPPLDVRWA